MMINYNVIVCVLISLLLLVVLMWFWSYNGLRFGTYHHGLYTSLTIQFQWQDANISLQGIHDNHISEISSNQLKDIHTQINFGILSLGRL